MHPSASSTSRPVWAAAPWEGSAAAPVLLAPAAIDKTWMPLAQPWQAGPDAGFQTGWARIRWSETGLRYEGIFVGAGARNSARKLNERTWELGDVGEIFVQAGSNPEYLEVHVTPENARLQLLWPPDGLARVRGQAASLAEFMIDRPDWVESQSQVHGEFWAFQVFLPAERLGCHRLWAGQLLATAVCRYDARGSPPLLSSTAALPVPFFHHREG